MNFLQFLVAIATVILLVATGLLFSNLYLLMFGIVLFIFFAWMVLTHYRVGRLSWSATKQIHFTSGILAVIVGSLIVVFTDWGKAIVVLLIPTHTYFLFYACKLVVDSLRDDKSFDKWSMIWSSVFLFVPFGLYFASFYSITDNSLKNITNNFDYICFSFATLVTAGCRDIQTNSNTGSVLYLINMFIGLIVIGVFVAGCFNLPDKIQAKEQLEAKSTPHSLEQNTNPPKEFSNKPENVLQRQKSRGKRKNKHK